MAFESKWWNMRSGELVNSSTISRESSDSIFTFFSKRDWKSREIYLSIVAMTAVGFGLGGLLMVMSEFWPDLNEFVKLFFSIIPMAAGYFVFYRAFNNRSDSKFIMEASTIFCMTMIGFSLFLMADAYFTSLQQPKLLVFWMLLSLPVIYMSGSSFGALYYMKLAFAWLVVKSGILMKMMMMFSMIGYLSRGRFDRALDMGDSMNMYAHSEGMVIWGWLFILLILPHFFDHFDRPSFNTRKIVLGFAGCYMFMWCLNIMLVSHSFFGGLFMMVCIYMLGKEYFSDGAFWWNRPLQTIVIYGTASLAMILSVKGTSYGILISQGYGASSPESGLGWFAWSVNLLIILGIAAAAVISVRNDMMGDKKANPLIVMFPVVVLLGMVITKFLENKPELMHLPSWLFTLYTFALGGDYVRRGIMNNNYGATALGVIILLIIVQIRFFIWVGSVFTNPEDITVITGIFYMLLAGGLIAFALHFYKKTTASLQ